MLKVNSAWGVPMPDSRLITFPLDPLDELVNTTDYRRRLISGILESYNSNYDFLGEALQNAVDAVEDAKLLSQPPPFTIEITINLKDNIFSVLDTGIGMSQQSLVLAYKPHVSFKSDVEIRTKRGPKNQYRGYKGVGLTFLAYGTDYIRLHSKRDGVLTKTRMVYGRSWVEGTRSDAATVDAEHTSSPLDSHPRGTYVEVRFSSNTRPKSLAHLAQGNAWDAVIRTRTAIGQVLIGQESLVDLKVTRKVISADGTEKVTYPEPSFLFPHTVARKPAYRFMDVGKYFEAHPQQAAPPQDSKRQDGLYLTWNSDRILAELTSDEREQFRQDVAQYAPSLYAFVPYQGSVWGDINQLLTGVKNRQHLTPGLMVAVHRQRLADIFEIDMTRYETFGRNVFVAIHLENAKPDLGRKTLQEEAIRFAKASANRAVQFLAKQRALLRPSGEAPTPQQRQVESNHQDWIFNVRTHKAASPFHLPPVKYVSTPLTEQDVVGLFHQFCALGVFPGIEVFATSQIHTYDCLIRFVCPSDETGLVYQGVDSNTLGLSPFVVGDKANFETRNLTLEFKNNIDSIITEFEDPDSGKACNHVDICVCWGQVGDTFRGYEILEVTEQNLESREYPGVTHLLRRDGEVHTVQVIMLSAIRTMVESGRITLQ